MRQAYEVASVLALTHHVKSCWIQEKRTLMNLSLNLPPDKQREMLRQMLTIRRFEERASADYRAGKIYGVVHCYIGEEAVAVGVCSALDRNDRIISTHRGHGHCIAKGADLNRMMAELYGRQAGYCKGKGGSMHIADFDIGMLGANGIVAGGISIVTGAGLAAQMEGNGAVAVSFFGDGASNAGPFHECLNIAATWKLPMLYVCENNLYAAQTPAAATHALSDVALRAAGYGIPGVVVDGEDVFVVYQAAHAAVERARAGDGPTLIECKTYRWRAHTERAGQPDSRDRAELDAWMGRDPIVLLERQLREQGELDDAMLQTMEGEIIGALEAAVAFAEASPFPLPEHATEDIFA
jgi:TPP-dependent pyruvate/acetoin dehydrogenase alpha subunit